MTRIQQLDAIIAQFDLNAHPFYQEWVKGTLPVDKLREYSAEYGRFIGTIADGWDTIGEQRYAHEEREHEKMWAAFQLGLGAVKASDRPQTMTLAFAARNLFSDKADAAGALYAFEAQQPKTSQSKLDGLNNNYSLSEDAKKYFVVHASDFAEAELLRGYIETMTEPDFSRTKTACAVLCSAMWAALDGIYYAQA